MTSINTFGSQIILDAILQSAQKTPIGTILAEAEEFKKVGDKQVLYTAMPISQILYGIQKHPNFQLLIQDRLCVY